MQIQLMPGRSSAPAAESKHAPSDTGEGTAADAFSALLAQLLAMVVPVSQASPNEGGSAEDAEAEAPLAGVDPATEQPAPTQEVAPAAAPQAPEAADATDQASAEVPPGAAGEVSVVAEEAAVSDELSGPPRDGLAAANRKAEATVQGRILAPQVSTATAAGTPVPEADEPELLPASAAQQTVKDAPAEADFVLPADPSAQAESAEESALLPVREKKAEVPETPNAVPKPEPPVLNAPSPPPQAANEAGAMKTTEQATPQAVKLEQLADHLVREVKLFAQGDQQSVTVRLHPASLGQMSVEVVQRDGETTVRLVSAHPAVRDTLEQQLPLLRESLQREGTQPTQVVVAAESSLGLQQRQQSQRGQANAEERKRSMHSRNYGEQGLSSPTPGQRELRPVGSLNVFI